MAELALIARGLDGDYFGGDAPGAADFTLYTILGFLRRCELKLPEIAFDDLLGSTFGPWMERMDGLAFAEACIPPHWRAAA
jgi:glutathione S-transferase